MWDRKSWLVHLGLSQLPNAVSVKEARFTLLSVCLRVVPFHIYSQLSDSCSYAVGIITASLANNDNGAGNYRSLRKEPRVECRGGVDNTGQGERHHFFFPFF